VPEVPEDEDPQRAGARRRGLPERTDPVHVVDARRGEEERRRRRGASPGHGDDLLTGRAEILFRAGAFAPGRGDVMRPIRIALAVAVVAFAPHALAAAREVPARWGPYTIELVDEAGRALPTFEHRGKTHVLGALGQRYLLRFRNGSAARVEVVASVDGRDVVDGRPASVAKRGYVVGPHGELTIDGYRLSEASVAAFRFSTVPRSYAARKGDARDVGVVGVAVFAERAPRAALPHPPPPHPQAAPEAADRAPRAEGRAREPDRPGLGTEFGEEHGSPVERVAFERRSPSPEAVLTLRYDDRPGLLALGIDVDGDRWVRTNDRRLRERATPFRSDGYCEPPAGWAAR
jgi:hypothetical protein